MMMFKIHDVGHGMCISLHDDTLSFNSNQAVLWDCGHKPDNRPSDFLRGMGINEIKLIVTNYDEDHISDLPNLSKALNIKILSRNQTMDGNTLRNLKQQSGRPISPAMERLLKMMEDYTSPADAYYAPSPFCLDFSYYRNSYDEFKHTNSITNNISLVTIGRVGYGKFIIPGDLEKEGWKELMTSKKFLNDLKDVNIFVASHHGRESGYCKEVFDYCKPAVVIMCDSAIEYETQEGMAAKYGQHATGMRYNGQDRKVLTTRKDDTIELPIELPI